MHGILDFKITVIPFMYAVKHSDFVEPNSKPWPVEA